MQKDQLGERVKQEYQKALKESLFLIDYSSGPLPTTQDTPSFTQHLSGTLRCTTTKLEIRPSDSDIGYTFFQQSHQFYKGQLHKSLPHGHGEYHYTDGHIYRGDWMHGKKHGKGVVYGYQFQLGVGFRYELVATWVDNDIDNNVCVQYSHQKYGRYVGQMHKGYRHGVGQYFYLNGDRFEGNFSKNHKTSGLYSYQNGDTYEGRFHLGRKVGLATYKLASQNLVITGSFNGDSIHNATITESQQLLFKGDCYLEDELFDGVLYMEGGLVYKGRFSSSALFRGKIVFKNGVEIDGDVDI